MKRLALLLLVVMTSGCAGRLYDPARATRAYPAERAHGETILAQATRDGDDLVLVNATAQSFENIDIWVNRRYMLHIESFGAGATLVFPSTEFFDMWGETPSPGGFFRTKKPTPLLLVELEIDDTSPLVGLVTVPEHQAF
jgi:hypothetical protein